MDGREFVEYDVEADDAARERMRALSRRRRIPFRCWWKTAK